MRFLSNKYLSFYEPEKFYHQFDKALDAKPLDALWHKNSALELHVIIFDDNPTSMFTCNINLIGYKAIILKMTKDKQWYLCGFDKKNRSFIDSKDYLQSYIHASCVDKLLLKGKIMPLADYENLCRNKHKVKINEIQNKK